MNKSSSKILRQNSQSWRIPPRRLDAVWSGCRSSVSSHCQLFTRDILSFLTSPGLQPSVVLWLSFPNLLQSVAIRQSWKKQTHLCLMAVRSVNTNALCGVSAFFTRRLSCCNILFEWTCFQSWLAFSQSKQNRDFPPAEILSWCIQNQIRSHGKWAPSCDCIE